MLLDISDRNNSSGHLIGLHGIHKAHIFRYICHQILAHDVQNIIALLAQVISDRFVKLPAQILALTVIRVIPLHAFSKLSG